MKILTVDDSRLMRAIIRCTVESLGFEALEASNGFQALKAMKNHSDEICLILLDWNMPGMSGFDLLLKLKAHKDYSSIPIMMVTTESESEHVIDAIKNGATNYLKKPFTPETLVNKITEVLGELPVEFRDSEETKI